MPMTKKRPKPRRFRLNPKQQLAQQKRCGDRIRELRNRHELTLKEFAYAIGYDSHSVVREWEMASHLPSADALTAMHQRFDVSPAWILGLEEDSRTYKPVVLRDGAVISEEQLEEALRVTALRELQRRRQMEDRVAKFMRQVVQLNSEHHLLPVGPCTPLAVDHLVALAEKTARLQWRINVKQRIARALTRELAPSEALAGELAARLAIAELEYERVDAFDEEQLRNEKQRAWLIYRNDANLAR